MEREAPNSQVILTDEERGLILTPGQLPVPASVSPRQARLALLAAGLLDAANAAVAASDEPTRIDWDYATEIRRDNPTIAAMATQLGLAAEQVDGLFRAAAQFP